MKQVDSVDLLRMAFQRIASTRMAGMPLLNPKVHVATIGFVPWKDVWIGVLVTPWFINLVAVSADREVLRLPVDACNTWSFPSGEFAMMGSEEAECGCFQFCSLFSPVLEFADQLEAESTGLAVIQELFTHPMTPAGYTKLPSNEKVDEVNLSRRAFLRASA